jgi:hypothetical protein
MIQDEDTAVVDSSETGEFVDQVSGVEVADKVRRQIQLLQPSTSTRIPSQSDSE